jgi:hypothetical protein
MYGPVFPAGDWDMGLWVDRELTSGGLEQGILFIVEGRDHFRHERDLYAVRLVRELHIAATDLVIHDRRLLAPRCKLCYALCA